MNLTTAPRIAVVIPCYRVKPHILDVIAAIGPEVSAIYVVDDGCPDGSGKLVLENVADARVRVLFNEANQGVGGATMAGYRAALNDGMTIAVKIDGDGQMPPGLLPRFVAPILAGMADYTKGNRFFDIESVRSMPRMRLFGNAVLSFFAKVSSGYWQIFDPNNGYTAIHTRLIAVLPLDKISQRYFFESDLLFRLNTLGAVVQDIPMTAVYADEVSNLNIGAIIGQFLHGHGRNFIKRIFYNYFLRNFSIASIELLLGLLLLGAGIGFGLDRWIDSLRSGMVASSGTVMLAALPIILGFQMLLSFLNYDMQNSPTQVLHLRL